MKAAFIIALISLAFIQLVTSPGIDTYYSDKLCSNTTLVSNEVRAFSLDFCKTLRLDEGKYRCCYSHCKVNDSKTVRGCFPVTYSQYKDIDNVKPDFDCDDFSIHCSSKYLTIAASFMALMFALF